MSFFKKAAKGLGKVLSKVGGVGGSVLKGVGEVTGKIDRATGGALSEAVFSNPLGAKIKAGYELAKVGSKTASGLGKALESGKPQEILKAGKMAGQSFGRGREIIQGVRRETAGQPRFGNLDIGIGSVGG